MHNINVWNDLLGNIYCGILIIYGAQFFRDLVYQLNHNFKCRQINDSSNMEMNQVWNLEI